MRPMMQTGQAAGTAAVLAGKYGTTPRGIYRKHIGELQQELLKDGCYLPGVENNDENDLALTAEITASSHLKDMDPGKVANGFNRVIGKDRNAWAPNLEVPAPHWLKLTLPKTTRINEAFVEDTWKQISELKGDRRRRVVVNFEPVNTDRVRIVATGAHSLCVICEVRLYCEAGHN